MKESGDRQADRSGIGDRFQQETKYSPDGMGGHSLDWDHRQRAYRYIYPDAGHIAQNLYLAGMASGLGICGIGALSDDVVNSLIGVDGVEETVLYMATAGWPAQ